MNQPQQNLHPKTESDLGPELQDIERDMLTGPFITRRTSHVRPSVSICIMARYEDDGKKVKVLPHSYNIVEAEKNKTIA